MEDLDLADPELVLIINITENKFCNDCQKKNPRWCSINNAVLLCASCARKHQKYNKNISKVKSLEGDLWTKDEIKKLYIGGNERFNKMLTSYNIPLSNENAEYKYHTKIAGYYRNLLNEEIQGKKIINLIKPSLKEGIELINKEDYDKINEYIPSQDNVLQTNDNNSSDVLNIPQNKDNIFANPFASDFSNNNDNNTDNFNNNNNNRNNNNRNNNNFNNNINRNNNNFNNNNNRNNNNNNRNNNNFEDNLEQHLNNFADTMSNVFSNISQKAQSIDYNEKLRNAGEYIKDKKEKIEKSDAFKGFMSAISTGLDSIVRKTEDFFNESLDLDNSLSNVNRDNSQQRRNFDNRNQNQAQFQGQRINNNNNNNNLNQNQSQNNNYNNNNNNDNNNNDINFKVITPDGEPDIPKLIEFPNNPQNINMEGEVNYNDNNVENLDDSNNDNNNKP